MYAIAMLLLPVLLAAVAAAGAVVSDADPHDADWSRIVADIAAREVSWSPEGAIDFLPAASKQQALKSWTSALSGRYFDDEIVDPFYFSQTVAGRGWFRPMRDWFVTANTTKLSIADAKAGCLPRAIMNYTRESLLFPVSPPPAGRNKNSSSLGRQRVPGRYCSFYRCRRRPHRRKACLFSTLLPRCAISGAHVSAFLPCRGHRLPRSGEATCPRSGQLHVSRPLACF